jgi:integrase
VAEQFLKRYAVDLANGPEVRRIIEREFVKPWGSRPVTDIRPEEVAAAIRAIVERGAPYGARNAFAYLRRLFRWALGVHEFGLVASPLERLSLRDLIGAPEARERVLTDAELRAVWKAADGLAFPFGPFVRMLILTGQRLVEVSDMSWSEVDFGKAL